MHMTPFLVVALCALPLTSDLAAAEQPARAVEKPAALVAGAT
jgi:hypothetical protein